MATKSFFYGPVLNRRRAAGLSQKCLREFLLVALLLLCALAITACATPLKTRAEITAENANRPAPGAGSQGSKGNTIQKSDHEGDHASQNATESTAGSQKLPTPVVPAPPVAEALTPAAPPEAPKIALILGPGGLRTFAHVGVLKEFARARIPVQSIVGLEWGALIAGTYSIQAQANEAEWKALRLRENDLPGRGFLSTRIKPENMDGFAEYLNTVFGAALFERSKIDFACPVWTGSPEKLVFLGRGALRDAMTKCMAFPPFFSDSSGSVAAATSIEEAASFLRARGYNLIIFVNVLTNEGVFPAKMHTDYYSDDLLFAEIRRQSVKGKFNGVNLVLNVPVTASIVDFDARRTSIEEGSQAARDFVNRLVNQYGF